MDPFGYWLLGYACIVGALFTFQIIIKLSQPWFASEEGASFMERMSQAVEGVMTKLMALMFISVPVGAVYACYRLGADLASRWR